MVGSFFYFYLMEDSILQTLFEYISEERKALFLKVVEERTRHITLVLEDLYQPHNASAVLRSCDCYGVQDIHIIENRNNFKVTRDIAMGSSKWVDIYKYNEEINNTKICIEQLKKRGYKIVATTPHTDLLLPDLDLTQKTALLFGTELTGLTEDALDLADEKVRIPMYGFTESFNISVSAALTLYDVTHRIRKENINWQLAEEEKRSILFEWLRRTIKDGPKVEQFVRKKYQNENH